MIVQALRNEFGFEAENTRKLLNAIPDEALEYRPQPHLWSIGQLASHIAEVYNWYADTFEKDEMDMGGYRYDKGDISKTANIVAKFEENVRQAQQVLENAKDEIMLNNWKMTANGQEIFPAMPRVAVVRSFLLNHLYHLRGELVAHLRAAGQKVPGLYGPTYEDQQAAAQ